MSNRINQIHRNRPLENVSIAYRPANFVADIVSPRLMVKHDTDEYYTYSRDTMTLPETLRANATTARRAFWNISVSSYILEKHSLKEIVTDDERSNQDKAIKVDTDATEILTDKILIRLELNVATAVQTVTNWSGSQSLSTAAAWSSNTTTTNPIIVVDSGTSFILKESGKTANLCVIDHPTFLAIKEHVSVVDRIKFTSSDSVPESLIAKLFSIDKLVVGRASYNTAKEGLDTVTMNFIWTNAAFLAFVEQNAGIKRPSALYTFWKSDQGVPFRVKKWRDEELEGDWVEVTSKHQSKPVATAAGYLILDTV